MAAITPRPVLAGWSIPLVLVAFVLFLLAALVGGDLITSSDLSVNWLVPGGLAAYMLAILIP